jgi:UDP-glucose 4-epimerase
MGRRVLITGLGTFWGGRLAQALERDPSVEVIIGLDTHAPRVRLERTEFVRSDENYSILSRIVRATEVDTVVHTFLVVDSTQMKSRTLHEINVIGTLNLFAAASAPGSTVRTVVVKSATLVYGAGPKDPTWFTEDDRRTSPVRTRVERSLLEVDNYLDDFVTDNPEIAVTRLRFSNVLGPDIVTPMAKALKLPVVPALFGFDSHLQFTHETDVVRAIRFVLDRDLRGTYNVAGDGLLPWSEVAALCGKRLAPMPPYGVGLAKRPLQLLGVDLPDEMLDLLRYGRGVDNRKLKAEGFDYAYTTAGAVCAFAEAERLGKSLGRSGPGYKYQEDVEQFFRRSPAVRNR